MTPDEKAAARERGRKERLAQGLPEHIEDPATLDAIVAICRGGDAPPPPSRRSRRAEAAPDRAPGRG